SIPIEQRKETARKVGFLLLAEAPPVSRSRYQYDFEARNYIICHMHLVRPASLRKLLEKLDSDEDKELFHYVALLLKDGKSLTDLERKYYDTIHENRNVELQTYIDPPDSSKPRRIDQLSILWECALRNAYMTMLARSSSRTARSYKQHEINMDELEESISEVLAKIDELKLENKKAVSTSERSSVHTGSTTVSRNHSAESH
ncbi:MAG: hypothetical protein P4L50_19135, partial [Anaerolineaceae bacterium]|nr:hypothetical protein [Anaerolineaceae bacterium]